MVACLILALCAASAQESYCWPLDLPRIVTSSFGEYRGGRFHAGIDLHTGQIGRPVHAPADGHVARVGCSPWGYGKAIYLELNDGHTVVFGHLNAFTPAVNEYVRKAQHAAKSYSVNLTPEPSAFPIKRGDVVAFSGETGIGEAHLHYEIRDRQGCPVNPRGLGVTWPDTTPPIMHEVLVMPQAPDSTVNGDIVPVVLELRSAGANRYQCNPIRISGRVGFGVDAIDPANSGSNRLGVYRLRTIAGDEEVFKIQMDRFSYDNRDNEIVSYYPFLRDKGRFLLQWRWPGNVCDIFQQAKSDGWYAAPGESVAVRLDAEDADGNHAVVTVPVEPDARPAVRDPEQGGAGKGAVDVSCVGTWLVVTVTFSAPEPVAPRLSVEGAMPDSGVLRRANATMFRAAVVPAADAKAIVVRATHDRMPDFEQSIHVFHRGDPERTITIEGATITVKPNSPYGTLFLRGQPAVHTSMPPVPMRGGALRLWPAAMPINDPIEITLPAPGGIEQAARAGVYRDAGNYWMLESESGEKSRFSIATRRLGAFAVLEDTKPPAISNIVIGKGAKRPAIRASVSDVGSGIADVAVTSNGQWLLVAYDPERNVIEWEQDEDLPDGLKELTFRISDKAGNVTTATRKIEPAPPKPAPPAQRPKQKPKK